ncbi:family 78 glycoside hydrolase catalytic domain [Flavisolibacter sp. BT320]|nr:family 78 glycoside hydrolase catalytic domain [Flavisolibacter longurius]
MKQKHYHIVFFLFCFFILESAKALNALHIHHLACERLTNPVGIDVTKPRLSWQFSGEERGLIQTAYQVLVASSAEKLAQNEGDLWNSGKIASDQSLHVQYAGKSLQSRQHVFWKVKLWTNNGEERWSAPASFSMSLLQPTDWKGSWIGLDRAFPWDSVSKFARLSARYFRKEVTAPKNIRKATAYIAGLGLYELYINGQKIGDQVMAPAPTDYSKTVLYNTFDVTPQVKQGNNAIGVVLGNGRFFAMRQNFKPHKWHTFGFPKLLLQLEIIYTDGSKSTVVTDKSWKVTADGPIRTNNEYDGEEYDATKELTGWNTTGFTDTKWLRVEAVKAPGGKLTAQLNQPMKVMDTVRPISIKKLAPGKFILDMGQNMAGWIKIGVIGKRGDKVTLRFAESLQPNGELYVANLRDAKVTDSYTLKGGGRETWCPSFVYHGFRYVEVMGYPGTPSVDDFTGEVVYDDLATIGKLETSNNTINQVYKNAFWGILSNYKGMPVDCPQRNERQPWLGDRTTGAYGESFLFDNGKLYAKWLDDIRDAQTPEGSIPDVAPSFWFYYKDNMTWPGAYLTIAAMLYRQFGDKEVIVRHYPSMKKWMAYMKKKYRRQDGIITKDSYGDWCVPPESPELIHSKDSSRKTDPHLIATAYYYHLLGLMQDFALLTNNLADKVAFANEADRVKEGFANNFYNKAKAQYSNNTVTANLLPLAFGLVPPADAEKVFQQIVQKIMVENKGHISTGVVGTQWLMRWLTKFGRADIAYKLATNTTYPSWGYMAENGATTIWELWNGNTANPAMNSQNHVMLLGDLLIWMTENLGGIQSDKAEVAFKKIQMKPSFVDGLNHVTSSYRSPYGTINSRWEKVAGKLQWNITVPGNTTALVYIPAAQAADVMESGQPANALEGVRFLKMEEDRAVFQVGSGDYVFTTKTSPLKN